MTPEELVALAATMAATSPDAILLTVTPEDFEVAHRAPQDPTDLIGSMRSCGVAQALRRVLREEDVSVGCYTVRVGDAIYQLDDAGQSLVEMFDAHHALAQPTQVILTRWHDTKGDDQWPL